MAEKSGFFDAHVVSGEYDRVYLAEDFAKYFASFIGNGVFGGKSDELMISQSEIADMNVVMKTGQGYIEGYFYENTSELTLAIDAADGVLNRIDSVVIRKNKSERVIRAAVKKGTPATSPSAPAVEQSEDNYELELARVYVAAGATNIAQANITDMRLDSTVCGFVTGVVKQLDTTELGAQLNSYIAQYAAEYRDWLDQFYTNSTKEIEDLKAELEAIAADVDLVTLTSRVEEEESKSALTSQTLGYVKKNLIPYPYSSVGKGRAVTINGVTFTDNGDGTVTANGTPTADVILALNNIKLDTTKKYIISDGLSDSSSSTYYMQMYSTSAKTLPASYGNGLNGIEFTPEDVTYIVRLVIKATVSNLVFKPMIRRAEITDGTWESYKKSVKEDVDWFKNFFTESQEFPGCYYHTLSTGEVEWVNPPDNVGLTYRTMERWNGNPVYQEIIYVGKLTNKTPMIVNSWAIYSKVVSMSGFAIDWDNNISYPFPIILSGVTPAAVISSVEDAGTYSAIHINVNEDLSNFVGYIKVKYTKA